MHSFRVTDDPATLFEISATFLSLRAFVNDELFKSFIRRSAREGDKFDGVQDGLVRVKGTSEVYRYEPIRTGEQSGVGVASSNNFDYCLYLMGMVHRLTKSGRWFFRMNLDPVVEKTIDLGTIKPTWKCGERQCQLDELGNTPVWLSGWI